MASHLLFKSPTGEVVQVKTGFSWQAFFVESLRALVKRTWLVVCALTIVYGVMTWMGGAVPAGSRNIALLLVFLGFYFGYMLLCGLYANRWLVTSLLRRGFRQVEGDAKR